MRLQNSRDKINSDFQGLIAPWPGWYKLFTLLCATWDLQLFKIKIQALTIPEMLFSEQVP